MSDNAIAFEETGLVVPLSRGKAYFNYYWLRDACASCIDPQTQERVFDCTSLPRPPKAQAAWMDGEALAIRWVDDEGASRIPFALLDRVAEWGRPADPAALPRRLWGRDFLPETVRIDRQAVVGTEAGRARLTRALIEDGIAVVTGMEADRACLTELATSIGPITPSAEGDFFEVRVEADPTNLAFTAGPLEMHTDLPGEETAPGVQFLHCLENTVVGGRSLFVDGVAVATVLRDTDRDAFDLLADHPIPFFYRHGGWDYRAHQRVIETEADGTITGVTVSQHLQDTLDLPQRLLDRYYPALVRFLKLLQEDRFRLHTRAEPGTCVVFDNHRVVHGREAYEAESGSRHLRGCYTDRGAVRSTYRVLAAKGFDGTTAAPR